MDESVDPTTLSDEELNKALGEEPEAPEEPNPAEGAEPETPPAGEVEEEPADPEEPKDPPEKEEPKEPSRRESLRIQQVLAKLKEQGRDPQTPVKREDALDYAEELNADPETIKRLQDDRQAAERAQYEAGRRQADSIQFHTRLEIDAPRVEAKFPFLDTTNKETFNPVAADAMNRKYLQMVGYNQETDTVMYPNLRYADFVEAEVEFANEIAEQRIATSTKNIAKAAASTGLRPDGSTAKKMNLNQAPQSMSDEELDAIIAQAIPKK